MMLKTAEMLFKLYQTQNDSPTLLIMQQVFGFYKLLTPLDILN